MAQFTASSALGRLVLRHREEILAAASRRHVSEVRVFGSLARGEDTVASDVDLLVSLQPGGRPLDLVALACDAQEILGVRVDVGTPTSLRPEIRERVLRDAVAL